MEKPPKDHREVPKTKAEIEGEVVRVRVYDLKKLRDMGQSKKFDYEQRGYKVETVVNAELGIYDMVIDKAEAERQEKQAFFENRGYYPGEERKPKGRRMVKQDKVATATYIQNEETAVGSELHDELNG